MKCLVFLNKILVAIAIGCFLLPFSVQATQATKNDARTYKLHQENMVLKSTNDAKRLRGFYGYEVLPEPVEENIELDDKKTEPEVLPNYTPDEMWDMHPDVFQDYQLKVIKRAVHIPNKENIEQYLAVVNLAHQKAMAVSAVAAYVSQQNTAYSRAHKISDTVPGIQAKNRSERANIADSLRRNNNDFGLLMFVEPNNEFCIAQLQIMSNFQRTHSYQFHVMDITLNPDAIERFNIKGVPSVVLVKREDETFLNVAHGVVGIRDLERNIYRSMRIMNGEIRPEQFGLYDFEDGSNKDPLHMISPEKFITIDPLRLKP